MSRTSTSKFPDFSELLNLNQRRYSFEQAASRLLRVFVKIVLVLLVIVPTSISTPAQQTRYPSFHTELDKHDDARTASATKVSVTYSGIFGPGQYDTLGYFGKTGADLKGKAFEASFSYTTPGWWWDNQGEGTPYQYHCGYGSGGSCLIVQTLTINNKTLTLTSTEGAILIGGSSFVFALAGNVLPGDAVSFDTTVTSTTGSATLANPSQPAPASSVQFYFSGFNCSSGVPEILTGTVQVSGAQAVRENPTVESGESLADNTPTGVGSAEVPASQSCVFVSGADLPADEITVILKASPSTSGKLTITINGSPTPYIIDADSGKLLGPGTHSIALQRTKIPPGVYSSVMAAWTVTPPAVSNTFTLPAEWNVYGVVRHSRYNTPTELTSGPGRCTGTATTAFVVDSSCTFVETELPSDFISQMNLNGTGKSAKYGLLKPARITIEPKLCKKVKKPIGATNQNTFFTGAPLTGSCNTTMVPDSSVATYPNPLKAGPDDAICADALLLLKNDRELQKSVADYCPACFGQFRGTNGHIDNYTANPACNARSIGDLGNFWTADTHGESQ